MCILWLLVHVLSQAHCSLRCLGGEARKQQMAAEHGGDVHAAYAEMGSKGGQTGGQSGGEARREQMAAEHGGDASAGYKEMGSSGGETRKEQMAAEHGGDASAGYSEMGRKGGQQ